MLYFHKFHGENKHPLLIMDLCYVCVTSNVPYVRVPDVLSAGKVSLLKA